MNRNQNSTGAHVAEVEVFRVRKYKKKALTGAILGVIGVVLVGGLLAALIIRASGVSWLALVMVPVVVLLVACIVAWVRLESREERRRGAAQRLDAALWRRQNEAFSVEPSRPAKVEDLWSDDSYLGNPDRYFDVLHKGERI